MKVIIAGGRDFDTGWLVILSVQSFEKQHGKITEIVCGMAQGADMMGFNYAQFWDIPVKEFPADWDKYGKGAGPIRNKEMAEYAEGLIAFWDGKSKGTKNMIDLAKKKGIPTLIQRYNKS